MQDLQQGPLPLPQPLEGGLARGRVLDQGQLPVDALANRLGLTTAAQPTWRQGTAQGQEAAGVALLGHRLDQLAPAGVHSRRFQHRFNWSQRLSAQPWRQLAGQPHHQAAVGTSIQPHPHQIPHPQLQAQGVGVGENLALSAGFHPDIKPWGGVQACNGHVPSIK